MTKQKVKETFNERFCAFLKRHRFSIDKKACLGAVDKMNDGVASAGGFIRGKKWNFTVDASEEEVSFTLDNADEGIEVSVSVLYKGC